MLVVNLDAIQCHCDITPHLGFDLVADTGDAESLGLNFRTPIEKCILNFIGSKHMLLCFRVWIRLERDLPDALGFPVIGTFTRWPCSRTSFLWDCRGCGFFRNFCKDRLT